MEQHPDRQYEALGEVTRTFEDRASGGTTKRPALVQLLAWVRDGDTVRVASMDRLARSTVDLHALVDGLASRGVSVQFVREGLTFGPGTSDPTSRLLLGVMGSVAEFERAIIRERQAEGIAVAKDKGVYRGRGLRLTAEQVGEARERVESGVPLARVAREAKVSKQTLYDALGSRGAYARLVETALPRPPTT